MLMKPKERPVPPRRKTPYVSTNMTQAAKDELQRVTLTASLATSRRITQSAVILAALKLADTHHGDFLNLLAEPAVEEADADEGSEG